MTKEELREHCEKQVKMCEEWAKGNNREPSGKTYEEHKLVLELIKASEQPTSDDCVSRQAVLDKAELIELEDGQTFYCISPEDIKALPPVTPTQRWIPVSKKLPEESGNYLIYGKVVDYEENCVFIGEYDSDYEMFGYKEDIYDSETLGFLDSEFCEYNKVIAWQPLPKPYEEKRGDENGSN